LRASGSAEPSLTARRRRSPGQQADDGEQLVSDVAGSVPGSPRTSPRVSSARASDSRLAACSVISVYSRSGGLELGQEPVHGPATASLVLERLADDPAGQLDGVATQLGTQFGDDLRPLRLQCGLGLRGDALASA